MIIPSESVVEIMKKWLFVLCTSILLSAGFYQTQAHAQQSTSPGQEKTNQTPAKDKLTNIQNQLIHLSRQMQNQRRMTEETDLKFEAVKSQLNQLNKETVVIKDKINKRKQILKERAQAYQQNGTTINYMDVLLGSTSLMDFVSRIGAVSEIVEADRKILEQQETDQKEYQTKKELLVTKLNNLNCMKRDLVDMTAKLSVQQKQYENLREQLVNEQQNSPIDMQKTNITKQNSYEKDNISPEPGNGYIMAVINAGYKYIGNSIYVLGGGRNATDVANGRFDCSGFVHWVFAQAGISIGQSTDSIKASGKQISASEMRPGDLVFFDTYKQNGHVGIYLGNSKFIGSQSSTGVAIADMSKGYWKQKFKGVVIRI